MQYFDPAANDTINPIGSKKNVLVFLTGMPQIGDLQRLFNSSDTRPLATSVLVKAAVPCDVSVGIEIVVKPTAAVVAVAAMRAAVASAVNNLDFGEPLYTSAIDAAILPLLTTGQVVGRIELSGSIVDDNNELQTILDSRVLTIPNRPESTVSTQTTVFILDPAQVTINTIQA